MEEFKCGIYCLYWNNCKYYYIGKSGNIAQRYSGHLTELKKQRHDNRKLQEIYNQYGRPLVKVLEECEYEGLTAIEMGHIRPVGKDEYLCNANNGKTPSRKPLIKVQLSMPRHQVRAIRIKFSSIEAFIDQYYRAGMPEIK